MKHIPTFSTGFAQNYSQSAHPELWLGLVGAWNPSIGKQSFSLNDFSLFSRNGSLNNMNPGTDYIVGPNGYALNYDGTDDFIDIGNITEINDASQDISISMWARTSGGGNDCLWYYDDNDSLTPSTDAYLIAPGGLAIGGIGQGGQINTGIPINDGLWHHIVVVLNGLTLLLYIDGNVAFSTAVAHNHANYSTSLNFRLADNANVTHHNGDIGDTLVYNRALRSSEVKKLYENETPFVLDINRSRSGIPQPSINVQEGISLAETITIKSFQDNLLITENLQLTENIQTIVPQPAPFVSSLIFNNPIFMVTDTDPAKIIKADITDPENTVFTVAELTGAKNAKQLDINSVTNEAFVACADGLVIKVNLNDLFDQITIDVSDTDDLLTISTLDSFANTFAGTENIVGELYSIDDRETQLVNTDFQCIHCNDTLIDTDFNAIEHSIMDSNFTAIGELNQLMDSDFKCRTADIDKVIPISQTDCRVFVDNIELEDTDLIFNSVVVTHTADEKSTAQFILCRRHDDLDTTLNGNTVIITNQNTVRIELGGNIEFDGKVSNLKPQYDIDTDQVLLEALEDEGEIQTNNVTLPLAGVDERLSLYHILLHNYDIFNPDVNPKDINPRKFKGIRASFGNKVRQSLVRSLIFDEDGIAADEIQKGIFNAKQNFTYFWSPTTRKFANVDLGEVSAVTFLFIGTSLAPVSEDLWELIQAKHRRQRIFDDIIEKIGDGSITSSDLDGIVDDSTATFNELENLGFITLSGDITQKFKKTTQPSDLNLSTTTTKQQSDVYEVLENALAFTVGEAPFQDISVQNGILISKWRWADENNGLFSIKDEAFNYVEFVKETANLEFEKLLNSNGNILPNTSATIGLTLDAYYYYGLRISSRINIDNTTSPGIYQNKNGFPIGVKSIIIDCSTMRVTLQADNSKTNRELEIIDGEFPDPNEDRFLENEQRILIALKTSMKTRLEVD